MSGHDLKLQVLLGAVDRVTGPMKKILRGTSDTARALKAAKDQLAQFERAQQKIQGFRKISAQAADSRLAMRAAYQTLAQPKAGMAGVENPTQKAARAFAKAEREAVKLKHAHLSTLRALRQSKAELASAGIETRKLGDHERRLRTEIDRTNALIDKQQHKLAQLGRQNQRLYVAQRNFHKAQAMAGAAASGGATMVGAGAALAVPAVIAVRSYVSFQDAMTGVARQVQGARDDAGRLTPLYFAMGEAIKQMSERLPGAAEDIAAIVEAGARMGIQGKQNLLVFAETTSVMADAFELPVDQVGADVSTLANLYKIPIANIGLLGDAINWLDDNTLSRGGDIIDVMKRIAGTADMVGMSYQHAAALGSTFLSLGATREIAGTASNAMIRELSIATMQPKRFRAGLEMLQLDAGQLQSGMAKDATGTIIKVLEAIKALPKEQQLTAATRLFGKEFGDDASKLANNLGEYRKQLALVKAAQSKDSMLREAQARASNLSAIWANTKDSARNLASELGATLAPALNDLMKRGASMAQAVREWVKAHPALAGGLLKAAIAGGALLTVIGGLALAVAGVIGPLALVKVSAATLGIHLQPMLATMRGLATRMLPMLVHGARMLLPVLGGLSAPVLAIIAAVAVAGVLLWKYWQPIKAFLIGMWQGLVEAMTPVGQALGEALAPLRPVWTWLAGIFGQVWGWLKRLFTPMQATSGQLQNATRYGRLFGQVLGVVVTGPIRMLIAGVGLLWQVLSRAFAWSPLGLIVRHWNAILSFFSGLWTRFKAIGAQLMQGLVGGLQGGLKAVGDTITGIGGQVVAWMKAKLGIHSPSRVFAQLGEFTMAGLAGGLDRSAGLPIRALTQVAGNMRRVGAGIAIGAAATPALAIDHRPPLSTNTGGGVAGAPVYHITINAPAGSPAQDIATLVRIELERIERERAARTRSRLGDHD